MFKFRSNLAVLKSIRHSSLVNAQLGKNFFSTETLVPVEMSYATYEDTNKSQGAPPFIIIHGLFGSKANWNSLCKVYQQKTNPKRKIVAADARNHGDSPHSDSHTYAHMVADLKLLLDGLKIEKATLMGHSMGGRAVMLYALKYPERVDNLLIVDISPISTSPNLNTLPAIFQAVESVSLPSNVPMSQARMIVDTQLSKSVSDPAMRAFLLTNLVQRDDGSYKWRVNVSALLSNFNNIGRFPLINDLQFHGPVLFLAGSDSDFLHPFSRAKCIQKTYLKNDDDIDLAYASYELTESYSKSNPEPTTLVVLHDLLASKNNWNSFCKRYHQCSKSKVIAPDIRNHGDSPHTANHSYDNIVIDLRRFLYTMNISKVCLLGHSMGGRAVMLFALKYPEIVEKLLVADISPITTSHSFSKTSKLLTALKKFELPKNVPLSDARKAVRDGLMSTVKNKAILSFILTNLVQKSDGSYGWRFNVNGLLKNFENIATFPDIHNIVYEGPVLFVGGSKSDYIQKSDYPKILKLFPKAEMKFIEGAGHWLHSEKPTEFLNITLDFLNKNT